MVDRTRHQDIFYAGNLGVTLIGLGGIGAITALTLGKMGVRQIAAVDDDTISSENIATQLHSQNHIGWPKATAFRETFSSFVDDVPLDSMIDRVNILYPWKDLANEIIISAVDSISSRKEIWAAIMDRPWYWYIDARMAAESLLVYTVDAKDWYWYANMLFEQDDSLIEDLPCTSKATIFCGMGAACVIGSLVRRIATGIKPPRVFSWNILEDSLVAIGNGRNS